MIVAILFDFDGTIVSSLEPIHGAWKEVFLRQNKYPSIDEIVKGAFYGTKEEKVQKFGVDVEKLHGDYREIIAQAHKDYEVHEHVDKVLREIKKRGIKTAIVSLGNADNIRKILQMLKIADCFDVILGGLDAGKPKPHPDIVYKAMEALNVAKEETLLVGDSAMDIQTGKNAGVRTGLYMPEKNFPYADREALEKAIQISNSPAFLISLRSLTGRRICRQNYRSFLCQGFYHHLSRAVKEL